MQELLFVSAKEILIGQDVDSDDMGAFLADFGRNQYNKPCSSAHPCNGDFYCDGDVDKNDIYVFIEDFARQNCSTCAPKTGAVINMLNA